MVGSYFLRLVVMVFSIIPLWFVSTIVKDKTIKWWKRRRLLSRGIISMNNWYEIKGHKGKIVYIGNDSVHLQGNDGSMTHIPIELICDGVVKSIREVKGKIK